MAASSSMRESLEEYELMDHEVSIKSSVENRLSFFAKELGLDRTRLGRSQENRLTLGKGFSHSFMNGCLQDFIIERDGPFYKWWARFILVWAVYSSCFTPFEFGFFRGLPKHLWALDIAAQVVFLIDIFVQFFLSYRDSHTYTMIYDHRRIAVRYAKSSFILDFLGCLPWDIIYKFAGRKEEVRYLLWIRLYRVRKLIEFFSENGKRYPSKLHVHKDTETYMCRAILHTYCCLHFLLSGHNCPRVQRRVYLGWKFKFGRLSLQ